MGNEIAKKYDFPQTHNATAGHCQMWKIYPAISKESKEEVSLWIMQKDELSKRKPPVVDKAVLEQIYQIIRKDLASMREHLHSGILKVSEVIYLHWE